ncbi:hypothetical protein SAMN05421736_105204 [Evansella caseinilytica]|uniref:Uncharacterized protein n=1 Tax=Evansella caseinilytica TaxID=1503961 RepID=A0A1H3PT59_9BACI|nr:hypothetical protein [Evansella caseinilytica]SDZ04502.1 hypothetical protein SAMN05421736_105204 [Evansella caseinilytica]
MLEPHYLAIILIVIFYVGSEVLLWYYPAYSMLKYVPGIAGIAVSLIVGYVAIRNDTAFADAVDRLFFAVCLSGLSIILIVVMSIRKPKKPGRKLQRSSKPVK